MSGRLIIPDITVFNKLFYFCESLYRRGSSSTAKAVELPLLEAQPLL